MVRADTSKVQEEPIRRSIPGTMGTRGTTDGYDTWDLPHATGRHVGGRTTYRGTAVLTLFLDSSFPGSIVNREHLPALYGGLKLPRPLGFSATFTYGKRRK